MEVVGKKRSHNYGASLNLQLVQHTGRRQVDQCHMRKSDAKKRREHATCGEEKRKARRVSGETV